MPQTPNAHRQAPRRTRLLPVALLAACWLTGCDHAAGTPSPDAGLAIATPMPAAAEARAADAGAAASTALPALPVPNPLPTPGAVPIPLPSPTPATPPAADGIHVLAAGEEAQIATAARLRFDRVVSDSRCPAGVQCVWAGEVRIAMSLVSPDGTSTFELSGRENRTSVQAFQIELLSYDACPIDKGGARKECASVQATAGSN